MLATRGRRIHGSLLVVLQLIACLVAPAADVRGEAAVVTAPLHIESEESQTCPQHHDHIFCQTVRSLVFTTMASGEPALQVGTQEVRRSVRRAASGVISRTIIPGAAGPRAPPGV